MIDFIMNLICFLSVMMKLIYSEYVDRFVTAALLKDEFIDFKTPLMLFDLVNNIDSFTYILMAVSFIKTLVFWKPDEFRIVTDMLGKFFSLTTLYTMIVSRSMATLGTIMC